MRALILAAAAVVLPLSACGGNGQADNTTNAGDDLTAASIVSNDVTAIDAVTGADANMAADLNYIPEINSETGESGPPPANASRPVVQRGTAAPATPSNATAPATAPASKNATTNAAANNTL